MAAERCFDVTFSGEFIQNQKKEESIQEKGTAGYKPRNNNLGKALISQNEFMFECKFQIHGMCISQCLSKARECKTKREQYEAIKQAEKWKNRLRKDSDKFYYVVKCPFKLIYQKKDKDTNPQGSTNFQHSYKPMETYTLQRFESKHIH